MSKSALKVFASGSYIAGANVALATIVSAILGVTGHPQAAIWICSMVGTVYGTANLLTALKPKVPISEQ
ncbi:hypothetical protein MMA231_03574 (plasmid) [Asticcacaulis sp. MM231]|uniref:hypothetical protein n=1 Tax=Asticcacaulis sp. MM231 TaxID=3157666 RepID=UPI0032D5A50D